MRSPHYEQVLQKQGVDFTYLPSLDVNALDSQAGMRNQARLDKPIDEELIEQYSLLYKEGSDGPPLVVYKKKNRSIWIPIDGNQRLAAAKRADKKTLDAYQINSEDQEVLDRLTWSFNNLVNGKRISHEESVEHAVTMVQKYGWDQKAAAKEWGVNYRAVNKRIVTGKLRDVLRSQGASAICSLVDDKLEELQPILPLGDDLFTKAATLVYKNGLVESDIKELKKDVTRAKTHDDKVQALENFSNSPTVMKRRAETKGGTLKPKSYGNSPCEQMNLLLKKVDRLLNEYDKAALRRKGVGYKETHELARSVVDGLIVTFGLGARLNGRPEKEEATING